MCVREREREREREEREREREREKTELTSIGHHLQTLSLSDDDLFFSP